eukprot:1854826-Amphidinium_carterae.2
MDSVAGPATSLTLMCYVKSDEVVIISVADQHAGASVQENLWPPSEHWLDKDCLVHEGHPLPTLVRPIPRARLPQNPSGLKDLRPHERKRWELDCYRLPLDQYADECMISAGRLQTPSAVEAEVLQGYVRDFTVAAAA